MLTHDQISLAVAEAANYADADAYVSDMLTSSAFLSPDETAQPDLSLVVPLRALWTARNRPFRELLTVLGKQQADLNRENDIPLRTLSGWVAETRTPPDYIKILLVRTYFGI